MTDLVEKVARAFFGEDGLPLREHHKRQARAAIAVVLREQYKRLTIALPTSKIIASALRGYAYENGVSLDD